MSLGARSTAPIRVIEQGLLVLCLLSAVGYVAVYIGIAVLRMPYPFELEWMEGASLQQVKRILSGLELYVAPSITFTPLIYNPLYFYVAASVASIAGASFFSLRLVSFLASLGCFALLYQVVKQETGERLLGLCAAGLFAATFHQSAGWFDLARVDSLYLFWSLSALAGIRRGSSRGYGLAGCAVVLAFFTKQTAVISAAPLLLAGVLLDRRRGLWMSAGVAGAILAESAALQYTSDGWYGFYAFSVPGQHGLVKEMWAAFWLSDLWPLRFAGVLALAWLIAPCQRRSRWSIGLFAMGMGAASWSSRLHDGGYSNVLMLAHAALAVLAVLGLAALERLAQVSKGWWAQAVRVGAAALLLIQFGGLYYRPQRSLPSERDRQVGEALVERIRHLPGDVFLPAHGYLAELAGKPGFAHRMAMADILKAKNLPQGRLLEKDLERALVEQRFGAIILENTHQMLLRRKHFTVYYQASSSLIADSDSFWPVTGMRSRPTALWLKKPAPIREPGSP